MEILSYQELQVSSEYDYLKKKNKTLTKCAYNEKQMCDNFCALDKSLYYPCGTRFKTD